MEKVSDIRSASTKMISRKHAHIRRPISESFRPKSHRSRVVAAGLGELIDDAVIHKKPRSPKLAHGRKPSAVPIPVDLDDISKLIDDAVKTIPRPHAAAGSTDEPTCIIGPLSTYFKEGVEIGRGGFGRVFLATPTYHGNRLSDEMPSIVAIKAIRTDATRLFASEIHFLSKFNFSHSLKYYGCIEYPKESTIYIVMEYFHGRSLHDEIKVLREDSIRLKILKDIALAIAELHSNGVFHRDLKPENILINEKQEIKLIDYGLACDSIVEIGDCALSTIDTVVGTPGYIDPFITSLEKSDWWAFGQVILQVFLRSGTIDRPLSDYQLAYIPPVIRDLTFRLTDPTRDPSTRPTSDEILSIFKEIK